VKELNIKKEQPQQKESLTILGKIRKKLRRTFLLLMAVGTFETITSFSNPRSAEATSYDKFKIENLMDWEKIELYQDDINKLDNISIINKTNENSNEKYLIIDKQNGKTLLYQGANFIKSYNVCLGDSIGDEQTVLKSTYGKVLEKIDEENYVVEEASFNEATYVENNARYLKKGYEAFTDWGKGNMKTGAGVYEISSKGPFLKDVGIFLKNERGAQVATSLHYNSHFEKESSNFRSSNGCVGFNKKDIHEIYESVPIGAKVYILPDNPHNKFKIIDGELRFVSNEQNVNKTIRSYDPKPIILKAENVNDDGREFLTVLANYKKDIMKLYPTVSNDVYNELTKIAYGIFGQESSFGTYGLVTGKIGQITDVAGTILGKNVSVGETQMRITSVNQKIKNAFDIKKTSDLFHLKKGAIATMSVLLDAYVNNIPNNMKNDYKKLLPLFYNSPNKNFKKALKNGKVNYDYSKKVLKYSDQVKVYMQNN
ncbi:MAG: murein L,D-transpeptidase, partial [Ignavibacteriales bacterium]